MVFRIDLEAAIAVVAPGSLTESVYLWPALALACAQSGLSACARLEEWLYAGELIFRWLCVGREWETWAEKSQKEARQSGSALVMGVATVSAAVWVMAAVSSGTGEPVSAQEEGYATVGLVCAWEWGWALVLGRACPVE
jgi:hypothetical protein